MSIMTGSDDKSSMIDNPVVKQVAIEAKESHQIMPHYHLRLCLAPNMAGNIAGMPS